MRLVISNAWYKDSNGNVWSTADNPESREFYKQHVLRVDFNDIFGRGALLETSLEYCSMKDFEYIITTSDTNDLELRDPSTGDIVTTYNWT